jgi:hypothetical protein
MRAQRTGRRNQTRRLRARALWVCFFAGLIAIAMAVRPGLRMSFTRPAWAQAEMLQNRAAAEEAKEAEAKKASAANAPAPVAGQPAKAETKANFADPKQQQIADDSAALLKLANSLKAEVDKTTSDTLSVAVIRQAAEIEKLAHKMRTKGTPQ